MNKKIAIIGGGNLGTAIAEGLMKSNFSKAEDIIITKRNIATLKALQEEGVHTTDNNTEAVKRSNLIILAVKPFQVKDVLTGIVDDLSTDHIVVSVVTGVLIQE